MEIKTVRTEVLALVLHFFITLAILGGYIYTVAIGHPDETLKTAVIAIIGYWFGVLGQSKVANVMKKPTDKGGTGGNSNG